MSENFKSIIRALPTIFDTEDGHKIGKEFNSPCIEGSYKYKRQTGDLTSNYLKILTDECVRDLLKTEKDKCRIQYITHMTLDKLDKETKAMEETRDRLIRLSEEVTDELTERIQCLQRRPLLWHSTSQFEKIPDRF